MNTRFLKLALMATFRGRYKSSSAILSFAVLTAVIATMSFGYAFFIGPERLFAPVIAFVGSTARFLSCFALFIFIVNALIQPLELSQAQGDTVTSAALAQGLESRSAFALHHTIRFLMQPYLGLLVFGLALHRPRGVPFSWSHLFIAVALTLPFASGYALGWSYCLWLHARGVAARAERWWSALLAVAALLGVAGTLAPAIAAPGRLFFGSASVAASAALVARLQRLAYAATVFIASASRRLSVRSLEKIVAEIDAYELLVVTALLTIGLLVRIGALPATSLIGASLSGAVVAASRRAAKDADDPLSFFISWSNGMSAAAWIAARSARFAAAAVLVIGAALAAAGRTERATSLPYLAIAAVAVLAYVASVVVLLSVGVFDRSRRTLRVAPSIRVGLFCASSIAASLLVLPLFFLTPILAGLVSAVVYAALLATIFAAASRLPHNNPDII